MAEFESVIGLEVHVQVKTESKLFCACRTAFGASPNSQICPICSGYPGVLPVVNKKAVESLVRTALAVDCKVNLESIFARKQYFYPDLPKNYQISQYEKPLAERGTLKISPERTINITRIHMEEDAGKLVHEIGSRTLDHSLVDLNRTGIPLMEIVSEPEIRTAEEAHDYLTALKIILQYVGVSDCDMEKGSMRCDANISIRPKGETKLGTKVEVKNMNSFRGVKDAIEHEIARQIEATGSGVRIVQETRLWNPDTCTTASMRSKEEAHDYRYFPEPDLLPILLSAEEVEAIRKTVPELPAKRKERFTNALGLSEYDAGVLTASRDLADYYEKTLSSLQGAGAPKVVSNWVTTDLLGRLNAENKTIADSPIPPGHLSELAELLMNETISGKIAKTVFEEMWATGASPKKIVQDKGMTQVLDTQQIEAWAEEAIRANPKAAAEFREGKERALGALVGAVMKLSKGQANPQLANKILAQKLKTG
jgi:aspartyl-tRNA(Asn)/glutamyl-tRNA(Gln) amidotransferase subunit B